MPTRVDITAGHSPDPVPSWLEDVDDESASASAVSASPGPASTAPPASRTAASLDAAATTGADDEATTVWRPRSAKSPSGPLAAAWSALGSQDTAPSQDLAEGTASAQDTVSAQDTAVDTWKMDAEPDEGFASTVATDDESGIDDSEVADAEPAARSVPDADNARDNAAEDGTAGSDEGEAADVKAASGAQVVAVVPGVPRYHEPNCILIRFMADEDVQRMSVPEAEKAGCTPCRACQSE